MPKGTATKTPAKGKPGTAVATQSPKKTALAQVEVGEDILAADGASNDKFAKDDLAIPFLRVLQSNSPQVLRGNAKYIKGSEAGMILDTVSGDVFSGETGVLIVPVSYTPSYIEWRIREKEGGIVKDHGANRPNIRTERDDKNRDRVLNAAGQMTDTQIVRSGLYYIFLLDEETGDFKPYAFPLSGTQLKKAKQWNTRMQQLRATKADGSTFNPAPFYMAYRLKTKSESNSKGSWFGVEIEPETETLKLPYGAAVYLAAREYRGSVAAGEVKVKNEEMATDVEIEDGDGGSTEGDGGTAF